MRELDHGSTYTVRVLEREDLNRQLVKSATCTVTIPEFELTIPPGKGQLTNIEGLLRDVVSDLSADQPLRRIQAEEAYKKIQSLIDGIKEVLADSDDGDEEAVSDKIPDVKAEDAPLKPFTLKLDDPAGNSFVEFRGSMSDPQWDLRTYKRTVQQNVALGLVAEHAATPESATKDGTTPADGEATDDAIGGGLEGNNEEVFSFPGTCPSCGVSLNTRMKKVSIPYFKVRRFPILP